MITRRENLLKVLRHEQPEWIPVTGHCDPYNQPSREGMDPVLAAALGEVHWGDTATVTFSRYLGLDIMGIVLSQGDPVIVKSMGGVTQSIPANEVKSRTKMKRSLMLSADQLALTPQNIADLIEYLRSTEE